MPDSIARSGRLIPRVQVRGSRVHDLLWSIRHQTVLRALADSFLESKSAVQGFMTCFGQNDARQFCVLWPTHS